MACKGKRYSIGMKREFYVIAKFLAGAYAKASLDILEVLNNKRLTDDELADACIEAENLVFMASQCAILLDKQLKDDTEYFPPKMKEVLPFEVQRFENA